MKNIIYLYGFNFAEGETIHCSNIAGHGTQNFVEAISNSCNPAFIQIGQMLGAGKFRQYYQGFGFSDKQESTSW